MVPSAYGRRSLQKAVRAKTPLRDSKQPPLQVPFSRSMSCIHANSPNTPSWNFALLFIKMSGWWQRNLVLGVRQRQFASSHLLGWLCYFDKLTLSFLRLQPVIGEVEKYIRLLWKSKEITKIQNRYEGTSALWDEDQGKNNADNIHLSL